jgi:hypothetical protein
MLYKILMQIFLSHCAKPPLKGLLAFGDQRRRDLRLLSALKNAAPCCMLNSFEPKGVPGAATNFNSPKPRFDDFRHL